MNKRKYILNISLLIALLIACALAGIMIGSVNIKLSDLLSIFSGRATDSINTRILTEVRIPRVLLAIAVGGGLSVAGAVFQAILMNPLAEPYILGISSGSAFGAIFALLLGLGFWAAQLFSFMGAFSVIALVFLFGKRYGELEPNSMLLSGVMVGAFFSASIMVIITYLNESLRTAVFWLIGSLSFADPKSVYFVFAISLAISLVMSLYSQKFNVLSLGSDQAKQLGVNTLLIKNVTYVLSSLLISMLVSVSGIIGFVGLLIPHLCRMIFGVDNRIVIPASFLAGGAFLTVADTLSRILIAPAEIPVGAITAFIGAPVFIYLLRKRFRLYM